MDDLHASAVALRDRIDTAMATHVAELAALRDQADALATMAAAAVPTAPDGTPIPARMLEAAREILARMLASGARPSKTTLATQLRYEGFRVGKELEWPIWRHVAPMAVAGPGEADGSGDGLTDPWDAPPPDSDPWGAPVPEPDSGQVAFDAVFGPGGFVEQPGTAALLNGHGRGVAP